MITHGFHSMSRLFVILWQLSSIKDEAIIHASGEVVNRYFKNLRNLGPFKDEPRWENNGRLR